MSRSEDPIHRYLASLEERHLARIGFQQVRLGVQALFSLYVDRRGKLDSGAAFEGAGKRAAFAYDYGVLPFLLVRRIVRALSGGEPPLERIVDLGCGTLAAGAAWALEEGGRPELLGVDRSGWAVAEARLALRALGLRGRALRGDLARTDLPGRGGGVVAAFSADEIGEEARKALLQRLVHAASRGARVLVVEPLALRANPWWRAWSRRFVRAGGREDEWRVGAELPERLALLHRAPGLTRPELSARSLWLPGGGPAPRGPGPPG